MMISASVCRVAGRAFSRLHSSRAAFSHLADQCDRHVVSSPFPPIEKGPYRPIAEFTSGNWEPCGGHLRDEIAIIDGSTGLTRSYADYYEISGSLAGALRYDMNIHEGSTVALYSPNHVEYLPISLAVSLCGAMMTPVNPLYTAQELETVINRSQSSVLIAHVSKLETALEVAKDSNYVKHVIVIQDFGEAIPEGTMSLDSLKSHDKAFHETVESVHGKTDTHNFLLPYSSGTTGLPKGVCLSHRNIVANMMQYDMIENQAFPPGHKLISPLPFFHIYAYLVSMICTAWKGNQVITMSGRFDLELFCKLIEEHKPQRSHLVPPILLGLAKHPIIDQYDLSSLNMIISAAAPLGIETEKAVKERLGCGVKQAWGMSELSPLGTINPESNIVPGSVGQLVSGTVGKIIDEKGNSLGPNEEGELLVKGPQVMMGYLNEPENTRECLSESGWLRTGDMSHYDENGYFYITDRIKELIKVRGFPVAPAELEALLLTHEQINDVAVIPVRDEEYGEVPRAYVVMKDTEEARATTDIEICEWVKERVAPFKRLDGGVVFTDAIPKSASGKILRRILRDQADEAAKKQ